MPPADLYLGPEEFSDLAAVWRFTAHVRRLTSVQGESSKGGTTTTAATRLRQQIADMERRLGDMRAALAEEESGGGVAGGGEVMSASDEVVAAFAMYKRGVSPRRLLAGQCPTPRWSTEHEARAVDRMRLAVDALRCGFAKNLAPTPETPALSGQVLERLLEGAGPEFAGHAVAVAAVVDACEHAPRSGLQKEDRGVLRAAQCALEGRLC